MIKLKDSRETIGAPPFCKHAGSHLLPNASNIPNCGLVLKLARYRVSRALEASLERPFCMCYMYDNHIFRNALFSVICMLIIFLCKLLCCKKKINFFGDGLIFTDLHEKKNSFNYDGKYI